MPTDVSWSLVIPLIVDGFLLGVGWALASIFVGFVFGIPERIREQRRPPP